MKFVNHINETLKNKIKKTNNLVIYGQNINAGSCLSGLTRNLDFNRNNIVINTQNSENCLVGFGFGLMLQGISSIFFMKQLDFLLLSIDHLVNTFNILRTKHPSASFTIFPITVDSGYEGPQSSLNNLDDFCSIANVNGYSINNKYDSKIIIDRHILRSGFRIITVGQKDLKKELLDNKPVFVDKEANFFQYSEGELVTILCFNQSLSYGLNFEKIIKLKGYTCSIFSVNAHNDFDKNKILLDIQKTKNLIVIDDSKSRNKFSSNFINHVLSNIKIKNNIYIERKYSLKNLYPCDDTLNIDYEIHVNSLINSK